MIKVSETRSALRRMALTKVAAYSDTSTEFRSVFPDDWEELDTASDSDKVKHQLLRQRVLHGVDGSRHLTSENWGGVTSSLLAALAGAGVGAAVNSSDRVGGAVGGGALGGMAGLTALVVARMLAAIRRRRTEREQVSHDARSVIPDYVVPGVADYNYFKRLGRANGDFDKEVEKYYGGK